MSQHPEKHRILQGAMLLIRRYFDHHVARDSAALTYYLLFALFPLLIFLSNLVGIIAFDMDGLIETLSAFAPQEVIDVVVQYLYYVSAESSTTLLGFSLVFSIFFPFRAANALFSSVRKAYGIGMPTHFVRYQCKVLLYTLFLIVTLVLSLVSAVVGKRLLRFLARFFYLNDASIRQWATLRFLALGVVSFFVIALLHVLAHDDARSLRGIWPGVLASLVTWVGLSMLFSLYVESAARYSLIYGSIGTVIVLLLWLYLAANMLIMGAEFSSVLLSLRNGSQENEI